MPTLFDRLDANIIGEISKFLTIKEKLLPFLSSSKSTATLLSSSAFKCDELILNSKNIDYIDRYGLSSWPDQLFSSMKVFVTEDLRNPDKSAAILLKLFRVLKHFPLINSFRFELSQALYTAQQLSSVLKSPSLTNIKILELRIISVSFTEGLRVSDFKKLSFPQLQSLTIKFRVPDNELLPISDFLLRHATIHSLVVDFHVMNEDQWNKIFSNTLALPNINKLVFTANFPIEGEVVKSSLIFTPNMRYESVMNSLATTIIPSTNQPRPLEFISLLMPTSRYFNHWRLFPASLIQKLEYCCINGLLITVPYLHH